MFTSPASNVILNFKGEVSIIKMQHACAIERRVIAAGNSGNGNGL